MEKSSHSSITIKSSCNLTSDHFDRFLRRSKFARKIFIPTVSFLLFIGFFTPFTPVLGSGFGTDEDQWPGIWFICEFSQRQRAPDDQCQMFDDEGFQLADGRLSYLRITESDETACRGEKKGQCFRRNRASINVKKTYRGRLTLRKNQFDVKYFGCTQTFYFSDTEHYREMWPDENRCFWASKRRFYIAPFDGIYIFDD